MTNPTPRQILDELPRSFDAAIASAMLNAEDLGLDEETDEFWAEVLGQIEV